MFKGIQKVTLVDFPGEIAATLFTAGCNFRCPWCQNWDLVVPESFEKIPDLPLNEVKDFLTKRKGKLDGVCITGGEPLLWADELIDFYSWCKKTGYKTKLDTNGYLPEVLESILDKNLLDYVAMDVKNTFEKYPKTVGVPEMDVENIKKSISILKASGVPHQFRTTVVDGLVDQSEMEALAKELRIELVFQKYRTPGRY